MSRLNDRQLLIGVGIILVGVLGVVYYGFYGGVDINGADEVAERYLDSLNAPDLAVGELMEFEYNFYVVYYEKSTDVGAFEMLIDKGSGRIFPEYGPNMMWNTKYGHSGMMHGYPQYGEATVDEEEAIDIANQFLSEVYPGSSAEDVHPFYGYYTLHTVRDGEIFGMLSVNQYTGEVWYHSWHGGYIRSLEHH